MPLRSDPWIAGRIDLALRALEGRPADDADAPVSFFDATRWRKKPPAGVEVARRVGVRPGTVYCIERDRQNPSEALGNQLKELLGRRWPNRSEPTVRDPAV